MTYSQGSVWYSEVESGRAWVECGRVRLSQVRVWESELESG